MRYIPGIKQYLFSAVLTMMFFLLDSSAASSQTPHEYFVGGADLFINGETEKARGYVDAGLTEYPDDKKLQALKKAIDEEKKDKNQNQDKEKNQDQNKEQDNKNKEQPQQNQQDKNQDQQKQQEQGSISKEDAQRLLDALANDEKKVQEKVKEAKAAKSKVRTLINW